MFKRLLCILVAALIPCAALAEYTMAGYDEANTYRTWSTNKFFQRMEELTAQLTVMAPKADYCDEVLESVSCLTTTQIAKELKMSAVELNRHLCTEGIQYGQSGQYMLYAEYARRGLAKNRSHSYRDVFGELHTRTYLVWTEKGRNFIHQLFSK